MSERQVTWLCSYVLHLQYRVTDLCKVTGMSLSVGAKGKPLGFLAVSVMGLLWLLSEPEHLVCRV